MPVSILKLQGVKIIISAFKTWILYTSGGSGNGVGGHGPCRPQSRRGEGGQNVVKYTHFEMLIIATRPCQLSTVLASCSLPHARGKCTEQGQGHGAWARGKDTGTGDGHGAKIRDKGTGQGHMSRVRGNGKRQGHEARARRKGREKGTGQEHQARTQCKGTGQV